MEIAKLRSDFYDYGITSAPIFISYDADVRTLEIALSDKSLLFTVPNADAKEMRDNWARLSVATGYSNAGTSQNNSQLGLVWNGEIYREIGSMGVRGEGASPPTCPPPNAVPTYTEAAKKAHVQGT